MNYLLIETSLFIFIAYLLGSLSSAIIICKIMRLPDPRTQGSGNPGATNVLRIGGKTPAIIALLGDTVKGVIPILIAKYAGLSTLSLSLIALAAFLGHLYPVFFSFKGGKGVATAFGCIITLAWPAGLALLITWLLVALTTRYSSLAALIAAVLAPIYMGFFTAQWDYTAATLLMSALLIYNHKNNIQKLLNGSESKIGQRPSRVDLNR